MSHSNNESLKEKASFDLLPSLVLKLTQDVQELKNNIMDLKDKYSPKEPEEYMTRHEVANLFKVDLSTIHNWTKKGILKPYYKGNKTYYLRSELNF